MSCGMQAVIANPAHSDRAVVFNIVVSLFASKEAVFHVCLLKFKGDKDRFPQPPDATILVILYNAEM